MDLIVTVANMTPNCFALAEEPGITGCENGHHGIPMVPIADIGGGSLTAVIGLLLALFARPSTGKVQVVDISMTDNVLSWFLVSIYNACFSSCWQPILGQRVAHV